MASGRPTPRLQRRTCRARGARAVRTARDHPAAVRRAVLQAVAHVLGRKAEIACVSFQMTFSFLTDIAFLITASRPIKTWGPVHSDRPLHLDHGRLALVPTWRGPRWCPCHGGGSQAEVVPSRCRCRGDAEVMTMQRLAQASISMQVIANLACGVPQDTNISANNYYEGCFNNSWTMVRGACLRGAARVGRDCLCGSGAGAATDSATTAATANATANVLCRWSSSAVPRSSSASFLLSRRAGCRPPWAP